MSSNGGMCYLKSADCSSSTNVAQRRRQQTGRDGRVHATRALQNGPCPEGQEPQPATCNDGRPPTQANCPDTNAPPPCPGGAQPPFVCEDQSMPRSECAAVDEDEHAASLLGIVDDAAADCPCSRGPSPASPQTICRPDGASCSCHHYNVGDWSFGGSRSASALMRASQPSDQFRVECLLAVAPGFEDTVPPIAQVFFYSPNEKPPRTAADFDRLRSSAVYVSASTLNYVHVSKTSVRDGSIDGSVLATNYTVTLTSASLQPRGNVAMWNYQETVVLDLDYTNLSEEVRFRRPSYSVTDFLGAIGGTWSLLTSLLYGVVLPIYLVMRRRSGAVNASGEGSRGGARGSSIVEVVETRPPQESRTKEAV